MKHTDLFTALACILIMLVFTILHIRYICPFRFLFHIPCAGCGLTRAVYYLLKGDIRTSLAYHPLGLVLAAVMICAVILRILYGRDVISPFCRKYQKLLIPAAFILTAFLWYHNIHNPLLY